MRWLAPSVRSSWRLGEGRSSSEDWPGRCSVVPEASPIVLVKKRDNSLRLCVDYRHLNVVCKSDAYPMPRVDELLHRLGKAEFITTLDLSRGYWQVPMAKLLGTRRPIMIDVEHTYVGPT